MKMLDLPSNVKPAAFTSGRTVYLKAVDYADITPLEATGPTQATGVSHTPAKTAEGIVWNLTVMSALADYPQQVCERRAHASKQWQGCWVVVFFLYQGLQSTIQHHVSHWGVSALGYHGETPVQKLSEAFLLHIRAGHKPGGSCKSQMSCFIRQSR